MVFCCNRYTDQAYWVRATNKREQLLEVLAAFNIEVKEGSLLSRCAKCNGTFIPRCRQNPFLWTAQAHGFLQSHVCICIQNFKAVGIQGLPS